MKTLTLKQPWASLVAEGLKRIETRSWRTTYSGTIAIHASKRPAPVEEWPNFRSRSIAARFAYRYLLGEIEKPPYGMRLEELAPQEDGMAEPRLDLVRDVLPYGSVIATCDLSGCVPIARNDQNQVTVAGEVMSGGLWNPLAELAFGDFGDGRWAWLLGPVRKLESPVKARGSLGLWEWKGANA